MLATSSSEVPLRTLSPGDGFELLLDSTGRRRPGYLCEIGLGSAVVFLLDRTARTIRTSVGEEVPIESVAGLVRWSTETLVVPTGKRFALDEYRRAYSAKKRVEKEIVARSTREARGEPEAPANQTEEGETEMKKSKKATKKSKKGTRPRGEFLYEAYPSKLAAKYGKRFEDPECTFPATVVVAQVLAKADGPVGLPAVIAGVEKTKRFKTGVSDTEKRIFDHLKLLVSLGLVKRTPVKKEKPKEVAA